MEMLRWKGSRKKLKKKNIKSGSHPRSINIWGGYMSIAKILLVGGNSMLRHSKTLINMCGRRLKALIDLLIAGSYFALRHAIILAQLFPTAF